jgi:type III secretion protein S
LIAQKIEMNNVSQLSDLVHRALMLVLTLSLPFAALAAAIGLVVALAQAVTQIQDQSIGQTLKLIAVLCLIVLLSTWMAHEVKQFAEQLFNVAGLGVFRE